MSDFTVRSYFVERVKPYRVLTSCGHEVIRHMREATAGVPYSPELVIERPNGMPCPACAQVSEHVFYRWANNGAAWLSKSCTYQVTQRFVGSEPEYIIQNAKGIPEATNTSLPHALLDAERYDRENAEYAQG